MLHLHCGNLKFTEISLMEYLCAAFSGPPDLQLPQLYFFFVELKCEQSVDGTQFDRVMLPSSYSFLMSCFIQPDTIMTKFSPHYCSSFELPIITSTFSHFPFFPLPALLLPRKFYLVTLCFFCVALASHEYIMTQSSLCLLPKLKIQQ